MLNADARAKLVARRLGGEDTATLAREYRISFVQACQIIDAAGGAPRRHAPPTPTSARRPGRPSRVTQEMKTEAVRRYLAGDTWRNIIDETGINTSALTAALKEAGIELRHDQAARQRRKIPVEQMAQLYEIGLGPAAIGRVAGITTERVRQLLGPLYGWKFPNQLDPSVLHYLYLRAVERRTITQASRLMGIGPETIRRRLALALRDWECPEGNWKAGWDKANDLGLYGPAREWKCAPEPEPSYRYSREKMAEIRRLYEAGASFAKIAKYLDNKYASTARYWVIKTGAKLRTSGQGIKR